MPIHADGTAANLEHLRKSFTRELTTLIGVEYLRCSIDLECLLQAVCPQNPLSARTAPGASMSRSPPSGKKILAAGGCR
jgi:hypothetical protein